ncbi:MAG TPA: alpha/beta hydrolase [Terriglobales bacterium]|nr:alpha/beta hydrolase [Terriglobales bacterium]
MSKVISKDGTEIAYETRGTGPAVILVEGAFGHRSFGFSSHLAELLAPTFTVYAYDRRGRGDSGNTMPFAVEREIEDIEALIENAGGSAFVYGISSGACLALEGAMQLGSKIRKLALYEPPYNSDQAALPAWMEYRQKLDELLAADRRGDAVALFMRFVGMPADQIEEMRKDPMWPVFEAVAPTLPYDAAAMGEDHTVPVERAAAINVPVLIMDGGANLKLMPFMHATASALARAIPNAQQRTLEGQTHDVNMDILAPILVEFFNS